MMPMPPSWARAMARRDSVTVSMAADRMGMLRRIPRQTQVRRSDLVGVDLGEARDDGDVVESESEAVGVCGWSSHLGGGAIPHPTVTAAPWHFLYFLPEPQGQGSLRPTLTSLVDGRLRALPLHLGRRGELDARRGGPLALAALLGHLLLGHRLVAEELLDDVVLDPVLHGLEQVEALLLVFVERVLCAYPRSPMPSLRWSSASRWSFQITSTACSMIARSKLRYDLGVVARLALGVALLDRLPEDVAQLVDPQLLQAQVAGCGC